VGQAESFYSLEQEIDRDNLPHDQGGLMTEQLTIKRTLLFSSASAGLNIMGISVSTWLLYFYSPPLDSGRTVYIPIALAGLLMTISSLWDAIIDPFIGHWSDNLRSKWGRRKPFIIFAAPVTAIALILIWTPPQGSTTALNALYFFFTITIFYSVFSLVGIPYDGSMPEMAQTSQDLVRLSTWKNIFGIIGVMIGALVAAPLFESIGPVAMGTVVGIVGLLTIWLTLAGLVETKKPVGNSLPVIKSLKATLKNRQFAYMFISVLIVHIAYAMVTANLPYFVTLVIGEGEGYVGIFQGILVLFMMFSAPVWNWLSKKYPNRKLLMGTMIGLGIVLALNFLVGSFVGVPTLIQGIIATGLIGPVLGGYFILAYAMMGSVVDYDEAFTNARREAIYYGSFSLAASVGPSLAALLLPFILNRYGFTAANPLGVRFAWLASSALAFLGAISFLGYKLGDHPDEVIKQAELVMNPTKQE
jgi:GPH family glycoside/pentoside/hexuronide:cation symporter